MTYKAPGKFERKGITIMEIMEMFPNEESARKWFESIIWPKGRHCPKCGSTKTCESKHVKMPYWCGECRSYFSVKTGTAIANSKIPLRKWCLAIYLCLTSLKSVSSMKLHRDIGVSQPTAWFMMHRIREAWVAEGNDPFDGPVEFNETYVGGKRAHMTLARKTEITGRGVVGKTAVVGAKDRKTNQVNAKVVKDTKKKTLHEFVKRNAKPDALVYTDEHRSYKGIPQKHETVNHSADQYADGPIHVNGIESFWSMFKREPFIKCLPNICKDTSMNFPVSIIFAIQERLNK